MSLTFIKKSKKTFFSLGNSLKELFKKMANVSDSTVNSDIFVDDVKTAIKATIKESKKRPHTKSIWQYLSNKLTSNIDEDYTAEILKDLESKKILVNKRKAKGDSCDIVSESQNKIENDVVPSDIELEINNECKTPTKNTFSNVDLSLDSITKSISNLTAEVTAIKIFIMDELYSLSRSIDRVRTEQIDQTNFMGDVKKIWEENSNKNEIIKTLLENLNTITNSLYKSSDKKIDKSDSCGHSRRDEFKIPKHTVTIDSHYRNKFVEKETPMLYNKFNCFNIDKYVVIANDVNDNGLSNNKKSDQVSRSHQKLQSKRPQVVVNNNPENQKTFSRLPVIPGRDKYSETVKAKPEPTNTLIFTDSIPKGIRMYGFNKLIKNKNAKLLNFPGASSRQLLHYMDIHLEGIQVDTVVIHIGVNDLLNYSNQSRIDSLMNNIIRMVEKCRNYGVKNIFLSGIVFTMRVSLDILIQVHNMISNFCSTNGLYYIDNRNIRADCLYKDGLRLLDKGKIVLANNLIINLNQNFLTTHMHHPPDAF